VHHAEVAIKPNFRCPLATVGQKIKQWQPASSGLMILRHEWGSITGQSHQMDVALVDIHGAKTGMHYRHLCRRDETSINHPILQQGKRIISSLSNDIRMKHPALCKMAAQASWKQAARPPRQVQAQLAATEETCLLMNMTLKIQKKGISGYPPSVTTALESNAEGPE
jgi:hypothetical protein